MKLTELYTVDNHEQGSEVRVQDDEGNNTALWINVKGVDSVSYRRELKKQKTAYFEAAKKGTEVDTEKYVIDALVACTIGWRGTDEKFTKKLCRELYTKAPFVKDQIDLYIAERANFTKAKPKK
tara:strand:- start:43 stop:414 length:372 start_codon:yes stop_codon:yes gene_type:complete